MAVHLIATIISFASLCSYVVLSFKPQFSENVTFEILSLSSKGGKMRLYSHLGAEVDVDLHQSEGTHFSGLVYSGNSSCLFRGNVSLDFTGFVVVSVCEKVASGFLLSDLGLLQITERQATRNRVTRSPAYGLLHPLFADSNVCGNALPSTAKQMETGVKRGWTDPQPPASYGEKTIAIALFYDRSLRKRFAEEERLNRYLLAVVKTMDLMFQQKNMRTVINLKMVVVLVEEADVPTPPDEDITMINDALSSFCTYQTKVKQLKGFGWDFAAFFTGGNFWAWKNKTLGIAYSLITGLAYVGSVCSTPDSSCTVIQGRTFYAGFVLAHELGHGLGMNHDNKIRGASNNMLCSPDDYLMSESTGPGKVRWSSCSVQNLKAYLALGWKKWLEPCLVNKNAKVVAGFDLKDVSPGSLFNTKSQCGYAFGTEYVTYRSIKSPFNNICRELWCRHVFWRVRTNPALPGTECERKNGQISRCSPDGRCIQTTQ